MKRRNKFNLSFLNIFSAKMGYAVPIGIKEVLPGDSFQHSTSLFVRLAPLVAPTMHPVNVRIHHWYIPTRLLWDSFESFITGGDDGLDDTVAPYVTVPEGGYSASSLADYLGVPTGVAAGETISALPFRAYALLWNECYRDQDLQTAVGFSTEEGEDTTTNTSLLRADWEKDYFTTARPWPQKGADVTIPVQAESSSFSITGAPEMHFNQISSSTNITLGSGPDVTGLVAGISNPNYATSQDSSRFRLSSQWDEDDGEGSTIRHTSNSSFIDLTKGTLAIEGSTNVGTISLDDVREAYAIQRFEDARGNYGSRYTEYLRYYGIRPSDARLQRPEYLGGSKSVIQFSEVLQTSPSSDAPLGALGGHGIAASRSPRYRRFFEEHGFVVTVMIVRPKAIYAQGLDRMWSRPTKFDYFTPELQNLSDQEVLKKELYFGATDPNDTFGYQMRYQEYKASQSQVHGEMRTVLDDWHMARIFDNEPTLNGSFVSCEPTDRIFAATEYDQLYCMAQHNIIARRMVRR